MREIPKHLEEKMRELADAIQVEIDKIDDPDAKFYRPVGTWRDNWEDGFEKAVQLLMPELREAEKSIQYIAIDTLDALSLSMTKEKRLKAFHRIKIRAEKDIDKLKKLIGEGDV